MDFEVMGKQASDVEIGVDYFVSKKKKKEKESCGCGGIGNLQFADAAGNIVFGVNKVSAPKPNNKYKDKDDCRFLLVDASGDLLISLHRNNNGSWHGFNRNANGLHNLVFRAQRTLNTFNKTEFEIFLGDEDNAASRPDFKIKGCAFYRACTIYRGNSVVAQTSLMYKLGIWKVYVPRSRFRLTIFPGFVHHVLIVALIIIYFDGRKIWV